MKLILNKNQTGNPHEFIRRAGYGYLEDRRTGNASYVRHLGRSLYPRFHLYLNEDGSKIILNLHLDQKRPSYSGAPMHNAEYEGEVVEREMERIRALL